jgi:hypothetical protein
MNIFVLDTDSTSIPAKYHSKHVVKMVLETAQLLCSAHEPGTAPYKRTHHNHPCSIWTRKNTGNYLWLCELGLAISKEYTKRYGKRHKSQDVIEWAQQNIPPGIPAGIMTPWPLCMPDEYKTDSVIESYHNYYKHKLEILGYDAKIREDINSSGCTSSIIK